MLERSINGPEGADRLPADIEATLNTITALQTDRGFRDARRQFFVEGVRDFVQVVDYGYAIECIIYSERLLTAPLARKLVRRCRRSGVVAYKVTPEQFRKLSQAKRASGVAAIVRQRWAVLDHVLPEQGLCWVLLETVHSPGNLGTLIRSSDAVGGAGFIFVGNGVDPYSPAVVRSAMGAIYRQTFVRTNWPELRRWIDHQSRVVIGATPTGSTDLHELVYPKTPLLLLGEERKGLTTQQTDLCRHKVRIPMKQGVDSLNLGVAGSLLMYEVYRSNGPHRSVDEADPG